MFGINLLSTHLILFGCVIAVNSDRRKIYEISKMKVNEVRESMGEKFWNYVGTIDTKPPEISSECYEKLRLVTSGSETEEKLSKKSESIIV